MAEKKKGILGTIKKVEHEHSKGFNYVQVSEVEDILR